MTVAVTTGAIGQALLEASAAAGEPALDADILPVERPHGG